MKSKAAVRRIVEELKVLYPNARCSLEYKKDYELLFAVRLSAQCTDARVNMVTPSLYQKFPTLEAFANATYEEVGDAIRSCGFYNTKSKDLVECAKILLEKHGGKVPGILCGVSSDVSPWLPAESFPQNVKKIPDFAGKRISFRSNPG